MNLKSMLPQESKAIGLLLLVSSAGCGPQTSDAGTNVPKSRTIVEVQIPAQAAEGSLALINGAGKLKLGDTQRVAFDVFPRPRGAFEANELPPNMGDPFSAKGWEAARESFGIIAQEGKVVLAQYTQEDSSKEHLAEIVQSYRELLSEIKPTEMSGQYASYWFWETPSARLMICAATDPKGKLSVTTVIGFQAMMNVLRMDQADANNDQAEATNLLQKSGSPR